jgi:hypothetical protein
MNVPVSADGGAVIPPEKTAPVPGITDNAGGTPPTEGELAEPEGEKKGQGEGEGEDDKRQRTDRFNRRIGQLTQQRNDLRRQLNEALSENERLKAPRRPNVNPDELSFDERENMRLDDALRRRDADRLQSQVASLHDQERQTVHETVIAKVESFGDEETAAALREIPLTEDTVDFLADHENPAAIVKHLRDNPEVAKRIFRLTFTGDGRQRGTATRASLREADRILTGIAAGLKNLPRPRTATNAPDPGTTLRGGAPPPGTPSLNEIQDAETYVKRRQEAWKKGEK